MMELKIMQWNIWYKEDPENIVKFLKNNKADIICLQEMTLGSKDQTIKDVPTYIANKLGYEYYFKEMPIESTGGEKMMLANGIFSKFPIIAQSFAWINEPKESGGYDDEYRAYVEIIVDVNGKKLQIGTTHMSYTHKFLPTLNKNVESAQLLYQIKKHEDSYIFTGDLNALPDSPLIRSIENILVNTGPPSSNKTWTTKPFSYNGFSEEELNWRLDYVFTTSDIKVHSSKILQTNYSDHLPILTKISL